MLYISYKGVYVCVYKVWLHLNNTIFAIWCLKIIIDVSVSMYNAVEYSLSHLWNKRQEPVQMHEYGTYNCFEKLGYMLWFLSAPCPKWSI